MSKIKAIFGIAVMAAILLGGLAFSQSALAKGGGGQQKVTLCHVDQETGEEITITVGAPAVPAHLAHGDTLGECPAPICNECFDIAETAFEECVEAGGTTDECRVEVEPSLTECALVCEGTEEDKFDACLDATQVQFTICTIQGGDEGVCRDDALDFFEVCFGEPLPA